jgi:DNA repair exonuclease SbcCD nuclease subunit
MGHGHLEAIPSQPLRSSPIRPPEIAEATCDYVALGHWDVCTDVSQGGTTAFYSGAPHHGRATLGLADVLLVHLDTEAGVSVSRVPLV